MTQLLEIDSKLCGKVQVSAEQKIKFKDGIYGFETLKDYYLLDLDQHPFYWLQSVNVKEVAFVVINPTCFFPRYTLEVDEKELWEIGFKDKDDINENLISFAIVTIPPDDPKNMTANLLGPIIINKRTRLAKQAVTLNNNYKIKHLILDELEKHNEGGN